ncbi:hypothetical protein HYT92_01505 [Candidatus Pacearchaeota archaeon]|nr:hypothetical protein [Candidatus Pacearchaeota archaeon]
MNSRHFVFGFAIFLLLISACAQKPAVTSDTGQQEKEVTKPAEQTSTMQKIAAKQNVPAEIMELFEKSKARVSSVYYKYRGPETGSNFHEFYIKGNKIKYKPHLEIKTLDRPDSYDSIFIDKTARTAASYCEAVYCAYKGKKEDLNYGKAYIMTIFDWAEVERAAKVGEEVIDSRSTWKLETNLGTLWVDTFYGIPLKVESNGKIYRFEQLAPNGVQDSDVVPSS